MADFNLHDPRTFSHSVSSFAGNYYYTLVVIPSDPSKYQGPTYFTVTSNSLLTEDSIFDLAQQMTQRADRYSNQGLTFDFVIIDATINKDITGEE